MTARPLAIFDLDGTLIDSRRDLADAANALIVERGGQPMPVEAIARMVGEGAGVLVRRALTAADLDPEAADALPRFLDLYAERLLVHTRLYDGIEASLERLAGIDLAVVTNKPGAATTAILEGLGIAACFRWAIGGDAPMPRKPDPAPLLHVMAQAASDPAHTVMVGDSAIDLAAARAAGTHVILARYGFGFREAEMQLRPGERVAGHPADLPALIMSAVSASGGN